MRHLSKFLAPALIIATSQAFASDLFITVRGGQPSTGQMLIGVFDDAASFLKTAAVTANSSVNADGSSKIELHLAPGIYAIAVIYDVNANGRMDRGVFGLPTEPFGFSRNPRALIGPPRFAKAAFDLPTKGGAITIILNTVD